MRNPDIDRGPTPRCTADAGATVGPWTSAPARPCGPPASSSAPNRRRPAAATPVSAPRTSCSPSSATSATTAAGLLDGLDLDRARAWLAASGVGYRDPGHRPWRPGAVFALATALRLADEAAEPTVDVRHLLLGVLADGAEDAPRLLRALGLDVEPLVAAARSDLAQPGTAATAARTWAASR